MAPPYDFRTDVILVSKGRRIITHHALGAVFAAAALASSAATAGNTPRDFANRDGAVTLVPASAWNIDYDEQKCRLRRLFGSDEDPYLLVIEQSAPAAFFGLTLSGKSMAPLTRGGEMFIGLREDQPMDTPRRYLAGQLEGFGSSLIFTSLALSSDEPEEEAEPRARAAGINLAESLKVDRIVLSNTGKVVVVKTGNMQSAFRALNTCTLDLLPQLGLDPEKHRYFSPPRWINQQDIAPSIRPDRSAQSAVFQMRVIVEPDGTVSDCTMVNATSAEGMRPRACTAMKRARFMPALDAAGEPMRSFYTAPVSYMGN